MIGHCRPSNLVDEIYNIMEDYETEGIDTYNYGVVDAITDYLTKHLVDEHRTDKYQLCCNPWPNMIGGCCSVVVVDNGYPFLIMFDYKY